MSDRAADKGYPEVPEQHAFNGRTAVLATMHGKEAAIASPLLRRNGLAINVPPGIDTDRLGTFSGEVKRQGTMVETAIAKARLAMAASGASLGLANEGSFGPHPDVFLVPAGIEIIVLVDDARDLVFSEYHIDVRTNYAHSALRPGDDLEGFLIRSSFPSHALIVRPNAGDPACQMIEKGIADRQVLGEAISRCAGRSPDGLARVETDMRAHLNPSRMKSIRRLAVKFAARLARHCPGCGCPGFGLIGSVEGLPCSCCGTPTALVKRNILGCVSCSHRQEQEREDGQQGADPRYCLVCNP